MAARGSSIDAYAKAAASEGLGSQAGPAFGRREGLASADTTRGRGSPQRPELLAAHAKQRREVEAALDKVNRLEANRKSPSPGPRRAVKAAAAVDSTTPGTGNQLDALESGTSQQPAHKS